MKSVSPALLFGLTLSACATVPQFAPVKTGQNFEQRTPPDKIEVFRSQAPAKPFIEIGSTAVCCQLREKTLNLLKESASKNGGDALIGLDVSSEGAVIGTVIRYR